MLWVVVVLTSSFFLVCFLLVHERYYVFGVL